MAVRDVDSMIETRGALGCNICTSNTTRGTPKQEFYYKEQKNLQYIDFRHTRNVHFYIAGVIVKYDVDNSVLRTGLWPVFC